MYIEEAITMTLVHEQKPTSMHLLSMPEHQRQLLKSVKLASMNAMTRIDYLDEAAR